MRKFLTIFIVGFLLALLCVTLQSPTASAHTTAATFGSPSRTQTVLLIQTHYGVTFSQRVLTCNDLQPHPCWYIKNVTRRPIRLDYNGSYWITLYPGVTASTTYASYGRYVYSVERNRFAQLVVDVQYPMRWGPPSRFSGWDGYGRGYSGWQY